MPSLELVLNVALGGILAGLVYGLMALGLSVIFGVVRVVNFAHGEMMTIAMYLAVTLFAVLELYKQGELTWTQERPFGEITILSQQSKRPCCRRPSAAVLFPHHVRCSIFS